MKHINSQGLAMIIRGRLLMIILFMAGVTAGYSQTYFFEQYLPADGLASSKVYVSLQDSRNLIWLGTEVGLQRFNGTNFENFSVDDGIAPGGVRRMMYDSYGRIWFGHLNGGLSYYDGDKFVRVEVDGDFLSSDVTGIVEHGDYLWISTWQHGALRAAMPGEGENLIAGERYLGPQGLSDMVFEAYKDHDNNLFFITNQGVRRFNAGENRFEAFMLPGMTREWQVTTMLHDRRGDYWFGTHWGGLYRFMSDRQEMMAYDVRDGLAGMFVTALYEDYRGEVWAGTDGGGITLFGIEGMQTFNTENGLPGTRIFSIYQDREKNIIITDYSAGMMVFMGDHIWSIDGESELAGRAVHAIAEGADGTFWLGTDGGISLYDLFAGEARSPVTYNNRSNAIGDKMRFLLPDERGVLWIGTEGKGVALYEAIANRFRWDPGMNLGIFSGRYTDNTTTAMALDKEGNLWIGTSDGLFMWKPDTWEGYQYRQGDGLAGNVIKSLYCDKDGVLWIGSEMKAGLTRHVPGSDEFTIVDFGEDEYIPFTITGKDNGSLFIGTGSGVFILRDGELQMRITEQDGLTTNFVKQLIVDGNYLYIGTNMGLNRYDLESGAIATFTARNGFTGVEAMSNATFSDSKGRLWFGTASGVTIIDPSRFHPVIEEPFTNIRGMTVNEQSRIMTDGMKLNYRERTISFDYFSICLNDPGSVRYRIMLEGADYNWRQVAGQTTAYYSALNPGTYTFKVLASNNYGYWNEEPVTFTFTIKPPFYKTKGFIISVIVLIIVIIVFWVKMREMQLVKEKRILEDKVRERTAEVVHKSEIIEEKNRDITASITYAERIQRSMLPPDNLFPGTFVLFMPKDIVSGDFYWMHDNGDAIFIAAVDCTGHGVPGAFMSIIGNNSLNKIVREYGITKPSAILDQLNKEVVSALVQRHEETISDGMDLSLIMYDKQSRTMEFAGAFNPLYLIREGELTAYKADRFPIGKSTEEEKKRFTNVDIEIKPGDMVYLFSDGFADQFGGENNQKYKSANVKKLLLNIWEMPVEEQKQRLEREIRDWMGGYPQIDDILFIGMKIE
jgi:ligand-binding sensor domain-containing protein/serine phosphatase RsbU (regulator of sigma subunit)